GDEPGIRLDGCARRRLDREVERRREPDRADDPEGVLAEARRGIADGPQDAELDVDDAAEWVDEVDVDRRHRGRAPGARRRVGAPRHRIHGEVPAGEVEPDVLATLDPVRAPADDVIAIAPGRP